MKKLFEAFTFSPDGSVWTTIVDFHKRALKSDFVRKVSETFATRVVIIGMGVVTSAAVARLLGPAGKGLYSVALLIGGLGAQFGNLGLHASNTYFVAGNRKHLPVAIGNSLGVSLGLGGLGAAAAWFVFYLFPSLAPLQGFLLAAALASVPVSLAYLLLVNVLLSVHEVRAYNQIEVFSKVLAILLIGLLFWLGRVSAGDLFLANLLVLVFGSAWVLWKLESLFALGPVLSRRFFVESLSYGWKSYLATLFAFLVLRIDQLMVQYMLGAEQLGYYSTAVNMIDMVYMLPVVVGTLLFPKLSAMGTDREKWAFTKKVSLAIFFIMAIFCLPAAFLCKPVLLLVYGKGFEAAVPAFLWLLPAIVMISTNAVFMNYFGSIGNPMVTVYSPGLAAAANVLLNLKLIPSYGIVGASIASVIAYGIMLFFSLFHIWRRRQVAERT